MGRYEKLRKCVRAEVRYYFRQVIHRKVIVKTHKVYFDRHKVGGLSLRIEYRDLDYVSGATIEFLQDVFGMWWWMACVEKGRLVLYCEIYFENLPKDKKSGIM